MKPITAGFIYLAFVAAAMKPDAMCAGTINIPKTSVPQITVSHLTAPKLNTGLKNNYSDQTGVANGNVSVAGAARNQTNSQETYNQAKQFQKTVPQANQQKIWQSHGSGYQRLK